MKTCVRRTQQEQSLQLVHEHVLQEQLGVMMLMLEGLVEVKAQG